MEGYRVQSCPFRKRRGKDGTRQRSLLVCQPLSAALTPWAFALVNVRAVGSINVSTVAASELVNPLQVIGSGQASISDYNLSVPVDVPRFDLSLGLV
jgi:hypothetical protein